MSDSMSLGEYLTSIQADADTVLQGLRYYLGEVTDDLSPEEMRAAMVKAGGKDPVDAEALALRTDTDSMVACALAYLGVRWADPAERLRIRGAMQAARSQLPVFEAALITMITMYAMYLLATDGKAEEKEVTVRKADGTFETTKSVTYASPVGPLQAVVSLFTGKGGTSPKPGKDVP